MRPQVIEAQGCARWHATCDEPFDIPEDEKETPVNWERIEGNWKQLKGKAKQQWGKLTDDQLDVIAGKREQLAGKIQESYGISKDAAEEQLAAWETRMKDPK